MGYKFANFINATLQQAIATSDTTIYIEPEMEALLPALVGGNVTRAVLYDQVLDPEIIDVTAHSGGALTITRSKESTTAQAWPTGTRFTLDVTAALLDTLINTTTQNSFTGTATGTNTILVTMGAGATIPTPSDGDEVFFTAANTTTGAATLTVTNGTTTIGPTAIVDPFGGALEDGDILTTLQVRLRYQSSMAKWVLVSQSSRNTQIKSINDDSILPTDRNSNGRFDIWSAGTSFSTPASSSTIADGYYVEYDGTIGAFTLSQQTFTLGQTTVPGNPIYFCRWDQGTAGSGSTYRRIKTKVGRVALSQGKKRVRSIWAKADAARTVTGKIIQSFGTGGSPSADVTVATVSMALTTSWQEFDLTTTMSSITGKTLGSSLNDAVILELSLPINTLMTIDFAMDQYEPGDTPSLNNSPFPWDTRFGGTGGSFSTQAALVAAMLALNGADLPALEALSTTGLAARTGAGTWATRTLTAPVAGITITNPAGIAGDPTIVLANDLGALEALSGTDTIYRRSGVDTWAAVTYGTNLSFTGGVLGGTLGTAALVADATLAHLAGTEEITGTKTFANTGLVVRDTDASHGLTIKPGSNLTANRIFTLTTGDAARVLDISAADVTITSFVATVLDDTTGAAMMTTMGAMPLGGGTFSGAVLHASGAVNAPGIAFSATNGFYLIGANNIGLAINGVIFMDMNTTRLNMAAGIDILLDSALVPSSVYSAGFRGAPLMGGAAVNAARTFAGIDMGKTGYHDEVTARTWTIDSNANYAAPLESFMIIDNTGNSGSAGALTIAITSDTLRRGDGISGTGSRTVGANQVAVLRKNKSTEWVIYGAFS